MEGYVDGLCMDDIEWKISGDWVGYVDGDAVGLIDGDVVGFVKGSSLGNRVGFFGFLGPNDGNIEGLFVGFLVGSNAGFFVGILVGYLDGDKLGLCDGFSLGFLLEILLDMLKVVRWDDQY